MNPRPIVFWMTMIAALGLVLGATAVQAAEVVFDPNDPTKAIRIENLDIGGTLYNVVFTPPGTTAQQVYGDFPGQFDTNNIIIARETAGLVNRELNLAGATGVGAEGSVAVPYYWIGFSSERQPDPPIDFVAYLTSFFAQLTPDQRRWVLTNDATAALYNSGTGVWADFTEVSEPVTIGGSVTGLEGRGLVLQNNGGDDKPIDADGPFTFDTTLDPGFTYNVTVLTNPTNPAQICSVQNGSGTVPTENVTDVAVTCAEPVLVDNLVKVAAEGDTLGDTVLQEILLDGGVAIEFSGQVAFGGRDDAGNDAAFTQAGKVVAEGDTLDDDTVLAAFRGQGEVAISAGQSGQKVAFHGLAKAGEIDIPAVFTQAGRVAAVGNFTSPGVFVEDIDPEGKVAINNFDQVAFLGKVLAVGSIGNGLRAVFISDGQEIQQAATRNFNLPDGTPLDNITESGGVAINDSAVVAFHGKTGGVKAVFTQNEVVAKVGDILDDTPLNDINEVGGVAINWFGEVAFHGQIGGVKAVFVSDGETTRVVAKVGDTLPDDTLIEDIEVTGGVAINVFGDVAFHGRTGGLRAVFTQNGLVAREASNLPDGATLSEISDSAGVAITPYGFDVAFHGRIDTTDAVFVGQAP